MTAGALQFKIHATETDARPSKNPASGEAQLKGIGPNRDAGQGGHSAEAEQEAKKEKEYKDLSYVAGLPDVIKEA